MQRCEYFWSFVQCLKFELYILGIWVAHGEGRAHFPCAQTLAATLRHRLAPLRYVDDSNAITVTYPHNPSGSAQGVAALCSADGRHLAVMPHPERSFQLWQVSCAFTSCAKFCVFALYTGTHAHTCTCTIY